MKKSILTVAALAAITTAQASDYYIQYNQTIKNTQSKKIIGIQPLEEIVGKSGTRHSIGVGKNYNLMAIGGEIGYTPELKEYDITGNIKVRPSEPVFLGFISPYLASNVGLFMQKPADKFQLSTSATTIDYILSTDLHSPSTGNFVKKPIGIKIGLEIGFDMRITKNISAYTAYESEMKLVQFSYVLDEKPDNLNAFSTTQRSNNFKFGLNYKF